MATVTILGSSYAVPDEAHENTHLAVAGQHSILLIDCAAHPLQRLQRAGLDSRRVTDLLLTHFHPDHVYGTPLLIMDLWLKGRRAEPLTLHGFGHCMERMSNLMNAYGWADWPGMFPVSFHVVEERVGGPVLDSEDFHVTAAPMQHFIPTMGIRVEDKIAGRVLAYSCDTEPCSSSHYLAREADLLIHEATGAGRGHTGAEQAGAIAREARARRLALIHYVTGGADTSNLVPEASRAYGGPVALAEDYMKFEL